MGCSTMIAIVKNSILNSISSMKLFLMLKCLERDVSVGLEKELYSNAILIFFLALEKTNLR